MANRASASAVRTILTKLRKEWAWSPSDIINLLRGGGTSSKGSDFERDLCRLFSRWWTDGERDDIFWRSSGSGARAKVRGRAGANTYGQHGDIAATDPSGAAFIDTFTVELKRGYSEYTSQDLFDRLPNAGTQTWEDFIMQTIESHEQAGSLAWLMITRRDRRQAMAWMPYFMIKELRAAGAFGGGPPCPLVRISVMVRDSGKQPHRVDTCGMSLDAWLAGIKPEHIKEMV